MRNIGRLAGRVQTGACVACAAAAVLALATAGGCRRVASGYDDNQKQAYRSGDWDNAAAAAAGPPPTDYAAANMGRPSVHPDLEAGTSGTRPAAPPAEAPSLEAGREGLVRQPENATTQAATQGATPPADEPGTSPQALPPALPPASPPDAQPGIPTSPLPSAPGERTVDPAPLHDPAAPPTPAPLQRPEAIEPAPLAPPIDTPTVVPPATQPGASSANK